MPQQSINALDRRRYSSDNDSLAGAISSSNEQTILVSDLISEGPIQGLVGGGTGIFINNDALQSAEQTSFATQVGVTATFAANSSTVTVNTGTSTFTAAVGSEGKKYLMVYGVYSTSVTMSDITAPSAGYTYTGNYLTGSGEVRRVAIGGSVTLTRTAGSAMTADWAHPEVNPGATVITSPITDNVFANLALTKSGNDLRGGLSEVDVDAQTAKFTWGASLGWKLLMSDADRTTGVVQTLEAGVFLEISAIDGNTITLANNAGITGTFRFGITRAMLESDATGAEKAKIEEKYKNSGWSFANGTIDQSPLPTIEGVGTTSVALTVSDAALEKNAARTITASGAQASEIDEVKFLINYPSGIYFVSSSSGREYPAGVGYKIELSIDNGGGDRYKVIESPNGTTLDGVPVWVHSGKYKSGVSFEMRINLEQYQPFNGFKLKITRMTQHDPNIGRAINPSLTEAKPRYQSVYTSSLSSVTGIIKEKLSHPHTALANISFSSKSFTNMPSRTYLCQGLKVRVPSNYVTREQGDGLNAKYTRTSPSAFGNVPQLWNGDFLKDSEGHEILVYTDNPAWVFYDILINNRYGLGDFLEAEDLDKYALYRIAKYCDELVPDGKGAKEPRFRANVYFTKATDAYKVLKDLATIFRGILYWSDGQFTPVIDEKLHPVYTFSRSNVIDGSFNYETTGSKTRVNQMIVEWTNPESEYKLEPIIIEDRENQIRTGTIKSEKAVAFGCTSEGQAIRYGRWKLWTALNQTELVSFATSANASFLSPGDVINLQDEAEFNISFSGRVNGCTASAITIDRAISSNFTSGFTYTIAVILPKRTILLNQDSAVIAEVGGGSSTYSRGDTITHATVGGATTLLLHATNEDLTRRQIESAADTSGDMLNLQYINETVIEERVLTTGGTTTVEDRDTIPIASAFSVLPTNGDMWAIKQVSTAGETTLASYKPYKILSIGEKEQNFDIVAVEYSDLKFDSVDKEFSLAGADPLFPPENTAEVPPPKGIRILVEPNPDQKGQEVIIEWDAPDPVGSSGVSTTYEHLAEYKIFHTFGDQINGSDLRSGETVQSWRSHLRFDNVTNGRHTVAIQTVSGKGRTSKKVSASIDIDDAFEGDFPRLGGLIKGGFSTSDVSVIGSGSQKGSVKFGTTSYAAAPFTDINIAKRNTTLDPNSYGLSCVALAHANWPYQEGGVDLGYLMMDFSALDAASGSANALKLIARKTDTTTYGRTLSYWYDGTKFVANANSIWASLGTCTMTKDSRKIIGSGFLNLPLGTVVTIGSTYAAKVALIESNTVMYVDYPWPAATATSLAISKQELEIDFEEDFIITPVSYNASGTDAAGASGKYALGGVNNTMSFLQITPELDGIGKSALVTSSLPFLSYNAAGTQLTSIPNTGIVLTATGLGFTNPEFMFTGTGFSTTNGSVDGTFIAGTNGVRSKTVHNNSSIAYSATPLDYTVTVREALDPDNAASTKSSIVSIGKLKEGSQGNSSALVYLYKMATTIPASPSVGTAFPANVTVSMTTGQIVAASGYTISATKQIFNSGAATGWFTVPTDTSLAGGVIWASAASANSTGTTDTIPRSEWVTPVQFTGNTGTVGLTGGAVNLIFKRAATIPATPSASAGVPTGWFDSPPAGTDLLWAIQGTRAAFEPAGTPANYVWTTAYQIEGAAHAEVYIYRKNNGTGNSGGSYNFTNNQLTVPTGWSKNPPTLSSDGDEIYVSVGLASGASTATAATVTYGTSAIFAKRLDGSAVNIVFKRATSASTPSPSAGVPTGEGWSDSPPAGTDLLWASNGTRTAGTVNYVWTTPFQIEGAAHAEVYIYKKQANAGGNVTGGSYNFTNNTLTVPSGWSKNPPALSANGDKVYVLVGLASGASTATAVTPTWSNPPVVYAEKTDGARGISAGVAELYQLSNTFLNSAAVPPTANPGNVLTYRFSDGAITSGVIANGWYQATGASSTTTPVANNRYLWKITAPVLAAADTDTIALSDWSSAILAAQYGAQGPDGVAARNTLIATLYYHTEVLATSSAPTAPTRGNSTSTFTFSTASLYNPGNGVGSAGQNWQLYAPTFKAVNASGAKLKWYAVQMTAIADAPGGDTATLSAATSNITFTAVTSIMTFDGIVAFTDLSNSNPASTIINGDNITTGIIKGPNFTSGGGGLQINLNSPQATTDKIIHAKSSSNLDTFYVDAAGNAFFKGTLNGANIEGANSITGNNNRLTIGTDSKIVIDGGLQIIEVKDTNNQTRVKIGKLS